MHNQAEEATVVAHQNLTHQSGIILPPFTGSSVEQWLKLCNFAFNAYSVNNIDQKCYLVLLALPMELQCELANLIVDAPNVEDKFELLSDNLIKLTYVPESTRMKSLLNHTSMGDKTPSEYLRHLRQVAGTSQDKDSPLLRTIFSEEVFSFIRTVVAHMTVQSLDCLAETADNIHLAIRSDANLNHLTANFDPNDPSLSGLHLQSQQKHASPLLPNSDLATSIHSLQLDVKKYMAQSQANQDSLRELNKMLRTLSAAIVQLQQQITTLQLQMTCNPVRNNGYPSRSSSRPSTNDPSMCYYHARFGNQSLRCRKPCSWVSETRSNDSGNQ
ncbi:uncharacterized protein LOC108679734 [Hyalella azteca]|uniref:Uncharacterized protein LOC108679734 n=1 Tax=Hyalella azteca TaxID=294128 RepID=A0A8B7PD64_HYAAZ|nr:uncharacterized protein LOC108679734 [Hyalella azteca]